MSNYKEQIGAPWKDEDFYNVLREAIASSDSLDRVEKEYVLNTIAALTGVIDEAVMIALVHAANSLNARIQELPIRTLSE